MKNLVDLTSPALAARTAATPIFLPIGGVEQHGPHLPLDVDTVLPSYFSHCLAKRTNGLVAPAIAYGARSLPMSGGGDAFAGTIAVPGETLISLYRAVIAGLIEETIGTLVVINGHYENEAFLFEAIDQLRVADRIGSNRRVLAMSWWSVVQQECMRTIFGEFRGWHCEHAAQAETALMLHVDPSRVHMNDARDHDGDIPVGIYEHPLSPDLKTRHGVLATCRHATAEMGATLAGHVIERIMARIGMPHVTALEGVRS